jgi:hypothetical protein
MAYNNYNNPTTIHDSEEGDSQIYVGIKYLGIVAQQINEIRIAEKMALSDHNFIRLWLNELNVFYDLVENRTGINTSTKKIKMSDYNIHPETRVLEKVEIEIDEKDKYEHWFNEILEMIERNSIVTNVGGVPQYKQKSYINNKKILTELSKCQRELMRDANKRHLIMPEGVKDMKQSVRNEWVDRESTKEFKEDV